MNALPRLGLLVLVLTLPVIAHAGQLPPASGFMLSAWLPEVASERPGELDIKPLREVARLARDGRFTPARKLLDAYERSETKPLHLYVAGLFRQRLDWLERGPVNEAMGEAYGDLWVHKGISGRALPPPSKGMAAAELEDARTAQQLAEALRGCEEMTSFALTVSTLAEVLGPGLQGGQASAGGDIQESCIRPLEQISNRHGQPLELTLLKAFHAGRYPQAPGGALAGSEDAEGMLRAAIATAREAGRSCATAHLLMRQGDLHAAPGGPVEMFGFNVHAEGLLRDSANTQRLASALFPPPAEELARAERLYDEARAAFASCAGGAPRQAFAFRDALLAAQRGQPQQAGEKFQRAAELARQEGALRTASLASAGRALAENDSKLLERALEELIGRGDVSGAVSLGEVVLAECSRRWIREGQRSVIPLLSTTARTLERARLLRTAALINAYLGEVFKKLGRVESSVGALEQAVHQQQAHIEALERRLRGAREKRERVIYEGALNIEQGALESLVTTLSLQLAVMTDGSSASGQRGAEWLRQLEQLPNASKQEKEVQQLLRLGLRSREFARKFLAAQDRTSCEEVLAELEALLPMADELARSQGMESLPLAVMAAEASCDPRRRETARARLARLDPLKQLREALGALRADPGVPAQLGATHAVQNLEELIYLSLHLEDHERAKHWLDALETAIAESPSLRGEEPFLRGAQARLALETHQPGRARELLQGLLQRPRESAGAAGAGDRIEWLQYLIEANAALGDDLGALLAWEQQRTEEERWEEARSGVSPRWRASGELAMLERKQALHGRLEPSEQARLQHLQQQLAVLSGGPRDKAPTQADLASVLKRIPPGQVVLVYTAGLEPMVWRLEAPGRVQRFPLKLRLGELERRARALRERVVARQESEEQARALYDALLAPVGPLPEGSRLLILAPGELRAFPFEVLGPTANAPLFRKHAVFYADHLLGPASASCDHRPAQPAVVLGVNGTALTHAEDEAREVAGLLRTVPLIGDAGATKEKAAAAMRDARLLHVAAEATPVEENVFASSLLLGGREELEAWWLLAQAPAAELVVLSACETRRRGTGGDAALDVGSNFAFQPGANRNLATLAHAAGARWVLASIWKVDDESTGELMAAFYRGLLSGASPADALQSAKLELVGNEEVAPYYYAGFLLSARSLQAVLGDGPRLCTPQLEGGRR